jgi:UDP-N-acetylmuramate--alanine ligase
MTSREPNTYFFCGIGGIGMSALAQLLEAEGNTVTGSDRGKSPVTEMLHEKGISVIIGQKKENVENVFRNESGAVAEGCLVYSDACPPDNVEREAVRLLGVPQCSYFEMLGKVSTSRTTVAIAGTHGKTTTTGMLAKILHDAGASPTAVIGSIVEDFGSNYLPGTSDLFVVEACEYRNHLLELSPKVLLINNLEWDHTDFFPTLEALQDTFRKAILRVPADGVVITDLSNPNIAPLLKGISAQVIDYTLEKEYQVRLLGEFNKSNTRAAVSAARYLLPDITEDQITSALTSFHGTWRRFEYKGTMQNGALVYDDYAHHPTAIKATLEALHEKRSKEHAGGRIIVAFHPHLYSRTKDLFTEFVHAFKDADEVILAPIFAAREEHDGTITSELLAAEISKTGVPARAVATLEEVETVARDTVRPDDLFITMGAGDIYKIADLLVKK